AVDGFFYFLDMVIRETKPNNTIYLLSDLSVSGHLPLTYHYSKIKKLNSKYSPETRPRTQFANLYKTMSKQREMVLAYMQILDMPGVQLDMFSLEERDRAIAWLLSGC